MFINYIHVSNFDIYLKVPQYLNGRIKKFTHDYHSDPSCKRHLDNLQIEVGVLHLFLNNGHASKPWDGEGEVWGGVYNLL